MVLGAIVTCENDPNIVWLFPKSVHVNLLQKVLSFLLVILGGWHDALSGGFVYFCFPMVHVNNTVDGFPGKHPSQPGLVPSKKGVEDTDDRIQSKTCLFCQEWSEG